MACFTESVVLQRSPPLIWCLLYVTRPGSGLVVALYGVSYLSYVVVIFGGNDRWGSGCGLEGGGSSYRFVCSGKWVGF